MSDVTKLPVAPDRSASSATWPRRPRSISVVCPVFREAEGIARFTEVLQGVLDPLEIPYEILFVEDDSPDDTLGALRRLHAARPEVIRVLAMSRRFGHQPSLAAGLEHARGQVVIAMDSDLQHPPAMLLEMLERWARGDAIVYTRRRQQAGRSALKNAASRTFYRVMERATGLPFEEGTADFRLTDEAVVDVLNRFGERTLLFRGLIPWLGFRRSVIHYDAPPRFAGTTNFSWSRLLRMGVDSLFAFSLLPLRASLAMGTVVSLASLSFGLWALLAPTLSLPMPASPLVLFAVGFLGGLNLLAIGLLGEYVGRVHEQVKGRPRYVVEQQIGAGLQSLDAEALATNTHDSRGTVT